MMGTASRLLSPTEEEREYRRLYLRIREIEALLMAERKKPLGFCNPRTRPLLISATRELREKEDRFETLCRDYGLRGMSHQRIMEGRARGIPPSPPPLPPASTWDRLLAMAAEGDRLGERAGAATNVLHALEEAHRQSVKNRNGDWREKYDYWMRPEWPALRRQVFLRNRENEIAWKQLVGYLKKIGGCRGDYWRVIEAVRKANQKPHTVPLILRARMGGKGRTA